MNSSRAVRRSSSRRSGVSPTCRAPSTSRSARSPSRMELTFRCVCFRLAFGGGFFPPEDFLPSPLGPPALTSSPQTVRHPARPACRQPQAPGEDRRLRTWTSGGVDFFACNERLPFFHASGPLVLQQRCLMKAGRESRLQRTRTLIRGTGARRRERKGLEVRFRPPADPAGRGRSHPPPARLRRFRLSSSSRRIGRRSAMRR